MLCKSYVQVGYIETRVILLKPSSLFGFDDPKLRQNFCCVLRKPSAVDFLRPNLVFFEFLSQLQHSLFSVSHQLFKVLITQLLARTTLACGLSRPLKLRFHVNLLGTCLTTRLPSSLSRLFSFLLTEKREMLLIMSRNKVNFISFWFALFCILLWLQSCANNFFAVGCWTRDETKQNYFLEICEWN